MYPASSAGNIKWFIRVVSGSLLILIAATIRLRAAQGENKLRITSSRGFYQLTRQLAENFSRAHGLQRPEVEQMDSSQVLQVLRAKEYPLGVVSETIFGA